MKTPVSNPESSKVIPNKKVKPVTNAKPGKKDRSCGKKKAKSGVSAPIKMMDETKSNLEITCFDI